LLLAWSLLANPLEMLHTPASTTVQTLGGLLKEHLKCLSINSDQRVYS